MSGRERALTMKELRELVNEALDEKVKPLAQQVNELSSSLTSQSVVMESDKGGGENTPKYRCRGKGCNFETEDVGDFVEHTVGEQLKPMQDQLASLSKPAQPQQDQPPQKRHKDWDEFMDCPECAPKLESTLLKRGWRKPEPQQTTGKKRETFL